MNQSNKDMFLEYYMHSKAPLKLYTYGNAA